MSERKVLNKYYPPDFDPTKIPRARQGKNRQFTVRLMAPCNMRCDTCGEYIYKGKKFNARKEDVENEDYLGLRIYRFYIKCTRCIAEICFKTDPVSTDYIIEAGATRNFMALKLAEEKAERDAKAEAEDDATNPMKVLEKRTEASRNEMAVLEALEELKELNQRHFTPDYENMLTQFAPVPDPVELELKKQEEEDEEFVQSVFGKKDTPTIKRIADDSSSDEEKTVVKKSLMADFRKPTDIMTEEIGTSSVPTSQPKGSKTISIGSLGFSKKSLVAVKPKPKPVPESQTEVKDGGPSSTRGPGGDAPSKKSALSLLGSYGSDSDSDSD